MRSSAIGALLYLLGCAEAIQLGERVSSNVTATAVQYVRFTSGGSDFAFLCGIWFQDSGGSLLDNQCEREDTTCTMRCSVGTGGNGNTATCPGATPQWQYSTNKFFRFTNTGQGGGDGIALFASEWIRSNGCWDSVAQGGVPGTGPVTVTIDFGTPLSFTDYYVAFQSDHWSSSTKPARAPSTWILEASNDGVSYNTVHTQGSQPATWTGPGAALDSGWLPVDLSAVAGGPTAPPTPSPTPPPTPSPTPSPAPSSTLLMKLKAGTNTFRYDASYWTDSSTLNEAAGASVSDSDDEDVKMSAFNTLPISALTVCYQTLSNCYTYDLGATYTSAQALFSSGFIRSDSLGHASGDATAGKQAWTDLFLPPGTPTWYDDYWNGNGGGNCGMQRPGINTQCNDNNWARIGYCVNLPDQSCQSSDSSDADSPVGIGLKTQNWPNNVNAPFGEYFIYGAGSSGVQQFQHQAWLFAGTGAGGASAVGDPHLQNVHGEKFDLMKPGKHVLINIPRGAGAEKSLLRVQADARQLGGQCADMYFQEVNVTGSWADAKQAGGYHYSVSQGDAEAPEWVAFGKVGLKVVHGRTDSGLSYLNVYVKHLGRAGFPVGGLLGEDDHEDVITPPKACVKSLSLWAEGVEGVRSAMSVLSFAEASLA